MGADLPDVPRLLREEGLDAFEYEAVRWGQKPQMRQENAEKLGAEAKENDVRLSLHGSYFINLSGKKDVVEASKRRLNCVRNRSRLDGSIRHGFSHWVLWAL